MAFDSLSAFIVMEGHGPYVWACYAVFAVLLGGMMLWSAKRNHSVIEACQRRYEADAKTSAQPNRNASATFARVEISQD
ncbi:heme exporter protein CcmD [Marinobacter sp.]|uniref:heme exporter protein CcmD n=1 Tax=Marinobacter sp. TaxID=50741 RepID=UPI0019E61C21|nr:heme exporter protein CcmD [Marinobacter sp.]MBE0485278.1 heme exporter protein CcmD [Marinobacter sp.]